MEEKTEAIDALKKYYVGDDLKKLERYIEISKIIHDKNSCVFCVLYRMRKDALVSDDIEFLRAVIKTFSDLWLNTEFDRDYYKGIVDETWPSAEEISTESLIKVKKHKSKGTVV